MHTPNVDLDLVLAQVNVGRSVLDLPPIGALPAGKPRSQSCPIATALDFRLVIDSACAHSRAEDGLDRKLAAAWGTPMCSAETWGGIGARLPKALSDFIRAYDGKPASR